MSNVQPKKIPLVEPRRYWFQSFPVKLAALYCCLVFIGGVFFAFQLKNEWKAFHDLARQRLLWDIAEAYWDRIDNAEPSIDTVEALLGELAEFHNENPALKFKMLRTSDASSGTELGSPAAALWLSEEGTQDSEGELVLEPIRRFVSLDSPPSSAIYLTFSAMGAPTKTIFSATEVEWMGDAYYFVVLLRSPKELYASRAQSDWALVFAAAGGLLRTLALSIVLGGVLIFLLTRRVRKVSAAMRSFAQDMSHCEIEVRGNDEISDMAGVFNRMARMIEDNIDLLERTDASRRRLFAHLSHDLRSPLTSLQSSLEVMQRHGASLSAEEQEQLIEQSLESGRELQTLIVDIFELATLDAEDFSPKLETIDSAQVLRDLLARHSATARERGIETTIEAEVEQAFILFDPKLFNRLCDNLLQNGIRYTEAGGRLNVGVAFEGGDTVIRISDTGIGISEEEQRKVFDSFYRADVARKMIPEGSGLGLAICKRIADLHACHLSLQSSPGEGSTFEIRVPSVDVQGEG